MASLTDWQKHILNNCGIGADSFKLGDFLDELAGQGVDTWASNQATLFGSGVDGAFTITTSSLTSGPFTSGAATRDVYATNGNVGIASDY